MSLTTITKNCRECSKTFSLTPEEQQHFINKGLSEPIRCPRCREKRRSIEVLTCKDCNNDFELNELEREFYEKKGYKPPKRCLTCRQEKREREAAGDGRGVYHKNQTE